MRKTEPINFWERNALSVELRTEKVFEQKLDYIHDNPVKAGMCLLPKIINIQRKNIMKQVLIIGIS